VKKKIFAKVEEKEITRAIVNEFAKQFSKYVESDCVIVGAGPSGLMAGKIITEKVLKEIGIPYEEVTHELYVADAPHACSKLIAAACDSGVKIANMTAFDDVVLREKEKNWKNEA
jgi:ribulose 1,5-bisphosphate synthetase/thiazole synthase